MSHVQSSGGRSGGGDLAPGILPAMAIDRGAPKPLYRQLYEAYRQAIAERRLRGGQRLPSTRTLAAELGISRLPVLNAFEQLLAEGYFESRRGAGTFVAGAAPSPPPHQAAPPPAARPVARRPAAILSSTFEPWAGGFGAFRLSEPAVEQFPFAVWSRLLARHSRNARRTELIYGSAMGFLPFRQAVAAYLRTARAMRCEAEQVMVVSGSQQALEITARALIDRGQKVWVEEPGYIGAREALAMAGARLVPVPVDDQGLDVAAGIRLSPGARAAVVTPSHQYPLGATMSLSRRLQLLDWAQSTGAWIVEDDYDSEYRYESQPIAALQGLDLDCRVIYLGTFSKVLFPSLRVGYLVIPADLVDGFRAVRAAMDIFPPTLNAAALTDFITEGHFTRHLRRTRALYAERRAALVAALENELGNLLTVVGAQAGFHLTALLPAGTDDRAIAERAARHGLWAKPLSACYLGPPSRPGPGLVLGYGGVAAADMPAAVRRLRHAVHGGDR